MAEKLTFQPVTTDEQITQTASLAGTIWHECFAHILSLEQIDYMVDKFQSKPAMTAQINTEGYEYFLLQVEGQPVGYISVHAKDDKLLLSKFYMLAAARGKGYGKKTLAFVEELGRQRHCAGVWLTVNRHNQRAIAVYRKTGFEMTREEVKDIGGGYVMDDYIFEKPI